MLDVGAGVLAVGAGVLLVGVGVAEDGLLSGPLLSDSLSGGIGGLW